MLTTKNLALTRSDPSGNGGLEFLYRVDQYGISAVSRPREELSQIHWEVDIIKYKDSETFQFEVCKDTELADKTLIFRNDKSLNEFLEKAFTSLLEIKTLEKMLEK